MGMNFSRPFGTWSIRALLPTLKRWAIVVRSLQDGNPDVYPMEYNHAPVKPLPHWSRHKVVTLLSRTPSVFRPRYLIDNPESNCILLPAASKGGYWAVLAHLQ